MKFVASDVAVATGGRLVGPDVALEGASFDSRSLRPRQLFVPIVAERDGHDFIDAALAAGAGAYLTARPTARLAARPAARPAARAAGAGTAIEVADTSQALLHLAGWARGRLTAQVVGISGSVGKTSTKDLVAAAVGVARRTAANRRSFNNEQGLPVTILDAPDDSEVLVLEMGMRGLGEIARLCGIGRPDLGIVTTVGSSHTELLGGIEGVARAKRELVEALPAHGTAVLNADDDRVAAMAAHTPATVLFYGHAANADVRVVDLELDELARPRFTVVTPWGEARVELAVSGGHMASNAAAAVAAAGALGVPLRSAVEGLSSAGISGMRMELRRTPSGALVVNDAYNANPMSMAAALDSLVAIAADRRVAILGPMAELDDPVAAHSQVADLVGRLGIELIAVGTDRYGIAPAADPVGALGPIGRGDVVLVKASRVGGLERIVQLLVDEEVVAVEVAEVAPPGEEHGERGAAQ